MRPEYTQVLSILPASVLGTLAPRAFRRLADGFALGTPLAADELDGTGRVLEGTDTGRRRHAGTLGDEVDGRAIGDRVRP